jgi:hypothetical protein
VQACQLPPSLASYLQCVVADHAGGSVSSLIAEIVDIHAIFGPDHQIVPQ